MEQKKNKNNSGSATANKTAIGGDDASNLIGSIVEKGISDSYSNNRFTLPPKLSVLPFPVARHRSHGPHWGPIASRKDANDDNEDDEGDEEDNDSTDFEPMSVFANPVQRKQKRGLDLRQWRELGTSAKLLESGEMGKRSLRLKKRGEDRRNGVALMEVDAAKMSNTDVEIDKQIRENVRDANFGSFKREVGGSGRIASNSVMHTKPGKAESREQSSSAVASSPSFNNSEHGSASFESEIDAENSARLQNMTPEEIADAQAEIMEKINPALLSLLKKRGQAKVKKQSVSSSEDAADNSLASTSSHSNVSPLVESYSTTMAIDGSKAMKSQPDKGVVQNSGTASGNLWSDWSKRVEAVRGLRFSLEGTPVTGDLATSIVSVENWLSADSNIAERDFLRTEGDPGAAGFTIKEAVQLTRSVIPGQRALALHVLAGVLDKAIHNIQQHQVGCTIRNDRPADSSSSDWEAIWAYALGPEPELVLALRMCLDDNHSLVVLACAKVIQCVLSCDLNEKFFEISEKVATCEKAMYTAAVFRSKPEIGVGFLRGGFWKYNAKPSNILDFMDDGNLDDETEEKHTIRDDITVAGQDFAAGLVRMGILPRMQYLLETNPTAVLEECIIRILIGIARHSRICANAIMKCQRLVDTVVHRFIHEDSLEIRPSKIKSVILLKVLAQSDKNNCLELIKKGYFQAMTHHLYQYTPSLNHWLKSGKEKCKLSSALMVEELRLWKVCIHYGCCISYFSDIFPALCLWLNPPTFEKLYESEVLSEFASIAREVYLVLGALARKLPDFYSQRHGILDGDGDELETWSWNFVTPMVDLALKWIVFEKDPFISKIFQDSSVSSLLWVYSAVMHMLSTVLERVIPEDSSSVQDSDRAVPWLPEFVPKIGLEIIKHGFLIFLSPHETDGFASRGSFAKELCHLRQQSNSETSLASVCFLHGLLRLVASIDDLIHLPKSQSHSTLSQGSVLSREGKILEEGIMKHSQTELRSVLTVFMKLVASQWQFVQSIETFSRGGPSPGVGVGWGSSGGGFWSVTVLLAQTDARLLIHMLKIFHVVSKTEFLMDDEMAFSMHTINSVLGACLTCGPRDTVIVEKALDILLQDSVFKYLDFFIQQFLQSKNRMEQFRWRYNKEDYFLFCKVLASHFRNRWLLVKRKEKANDEHISSVNNNVRLETIHEDFVTSNMENQDHYCTTLTAEWAHQRLPLPMHWFLSPISTPSATFQCPANKADLMQDPSGMLEVTKGGLFLLLGLEAMSTFLADDNPSPIRSVPLVWKLHSLSVILLIGMGVLEDDNSRHIYEVLQDLYGQLLDEARSTKGHEHTLEEHINILPESGNKYAVEFLRFQSEIHDSYSTFIETLVEQFAGVSYGDLLFGRQVAVYLHRCSESAVRLSAWNALSNARVLEILPPLEKCFGEAQGYLDPIEDNEGVLEAYVKSWVSGALDRAATRGTMAFSLALHHLSYFIFLAAGVHDKMIPLRIKLAKSLLRDYSQKPRHEGMVLDLIGHCKPPISHMVEAQEVWLLQTQSSDIERRFEILAEACDRDSSLLTVVDKLKSAFIQKHHLVT